MAELTEIQNFYSGKTIFVTGGTGFAGKCLVEKLLRSCPVKSVILIIRSKRNKSVHERIEEYFKDVIFNTIKCNNAQVLEKVNFIEGNIMLDNLGLNPDDYDMIINSTNILFHCAATLKFLAPLHEAIATNLKATLTVIEMAQKMKKLEALVYISTAFTQFITEYFEENVSNLSYNPTYFMDMVQNMSKEDLHKISPSLLGKWPNSYVFTKHLAERSIKEKCDNNLPVCIYRPVAISQAYREPIPGWSNTFTGAMGVGVSLSMGAIKIVNKSPDCQIHLIPVDMVANCIIAVAWRTATDSEKRLTVYNHTSNKLVTRNNLWDNAVHNNYPLECSFRYPGYTIVDVSPWIFNIFAFFIHTIPNFLIDAGLRICGKEPKCQAMCTAASKLFTTISTFVTCEFNFELKNVAALWNHLKPEDRELFNFDAYSINWYEYMDITVRGNKEILLKENIANIKSAKLKHKLLYYMEYLYIFLYMLVLFCIIKILSIII